MTTITTEQLAEWRALAEKATEGPWAIESCGEKGDGSNMIGVVFGPDDPDAKSPLSGWIDENDWADKLGEPMADPFYRDEEVAECAHRNRNHNADAAFIAAARTAVPALIAEVERLREALTPSTDTKAAYIGEFSHRVTSISDDGEEQYFDAAVPWPTIKEIMAAILARAALPEESADG